VIVLPMRAQVPPELLEQLRPGQLVLGGCLGSQREKLTACGVRAFDYYDDVQLQYANAVPTAEGALGILIDRTPETIRGSKGLVIGYGRIGTVLANQLSLLGAEVTASARKETDLGRIVAAGHQAERTGTWQFSMKRYDYIVNTVPARVLTEREYRQMRPDAVLLELASEPGGFDEALCRECFLTLIRAPGLPGKCAPKTAGAAIAGAVLRILESESKHET
jgi:dipicolinate synthase subunit A